MESPIFYRPTQYSEKRKVLLRSTGSFSVIEDNIVAPTPRKFPNIACSPKYGRRDKRKNEDTSLYGEAGTEIQSILFHPQNLIAAATHIVALPVTHVLNEEDAVVPMKITPLRASNPITLNSPFEQTNGSSIEQQQSTITSTARLYPANGRLRTNTHHYSTRKELNRSRSLSWPGLPKA